MFNLFKKKSQSLAIEKRSIDRNKLEERLCEIDIPYEYAEEICSNLKKDVDYKTLYELFISYFIKNDKTDIDNQPPHVDLIIGINGAGKTTTIAKLANMVKESAMICAGDTFRAAAIEQIKKWGERLNIPVVSSKIGHDPSAIAYDSVKSAQAKNIKNLIIDTAGRLHTNTNLLNELLKIKKVVEKALDREIDRKILVIDGTQSMSAINQAKKFKETIGIDSIIVTKLDGTAKGGAMLIIARELNIPIIYIGTGEGVNDILPFDCDSYIKDLLGVIFE